MRRMQKSNEEIRKHMDQLERENRDIKSSTHKDVLRGAGVGG